MEKEPQAGAGYCLQDRVSPRHSRVAFHAAPSYV